MLLHIPGVLDREQVAAMRSAPIQITAARELVAQMR